MREVLPDNAPATNLAVFITADGTFSVDVRVEQDTVWLTQKQIAHLFKTSTDNIGLHLKNIYSEGELREAATAEKSSVVQTEGSRQVRRTTLHYNLDAILSVGYRVNSRRGTEFRIWATRTLKDHLMRGFTANQARLAARGLDDIQSTISLLAQTLSRQKLVTAEGQAVLDVVQAYARSWRLLLEFDEDRLDASPAPATKPKRPLTAAQARAAITKLKRQLMGQGSASNIFGIERSDQLEGIIYGLDQTWDGQPLYPTAESRAAHLLYFVIKDHPFTDGNKRIGAMLFLEYLNRNHALVGPGGIPRIANETLVALALLIAESAPGQKDMLIRLTVNLIAG